MIIRTLISFIALPGIIAIVVPSLIAYFDPWRQGYWTPGIYIMSIGFFVLLWCIRDFYKSGKGTLAPWDPPKKMVVVGLYRFMRNPMYVGVLLLVLGSGFYCQSTILVLYAVVLAIGFHVRVIRSEEPWLESHFRKQWEIYQKEVSRWLPRLKPWYGDS
jgi:protein-S-isoprenylcysteine O-methyltransferase Ste14